jgi:purine-binding chemotaxis protein CheW
LRGDVIPIIDLRDRFGLGQSAQTDSTRVIVAEVDDRHMGMIVDSASQVVRIPSSQIEPPPAVLDGLSVEFITGVGKLGDKLVILLDASAVLSTDEKIELGGVGSMAQVGER